MKHWCVLNIVARKGNRRSNSNVQIHIMFLVDLANEFDRQCSNMDIHGCCITIKQQHSQIYRPSAQSKCNFFLVNFARSLLTNNRFVCTYFDIRFIQKLCFSCVLLLLIMDVVFAFAFVFVFLRCYYLHVFILNFCFSV